MGDLRWSNRRRQWQPTPVLLSGKSQGRRSLIGCSPWGHKESDTTERLHFHFSVSCIGEGNGNPLQCSCLENPRDRGAWWAAVYGVAQNGTRLKRLSSSSNKLVITFLPRSKCLLISWLQSPFAVILEPKKIKSATVSPSNCREVMGQDAMISVFWMLSFKPTFSLPLFTFIKKLFSSSSLSAIRVVSSTYLKLLIFLPAILIPACASSS